MIKYALPTPIKLNNNNIIFIPCQKKNRYLGLIFDKCFTWAFRLNSKRKSANSRLLILSKIPTTRKLMVNLGIRYNNGLLV